MPAKRKPGPEMRAPDGKYKPVLKAAKEWNRLTKPLCSIGFKPHGYDPGVSLYSPSGRYVHLDIETIELLNDVIKKAEMYDKIVHPVRRKVYLPP